MKRKNKWFRAFVGMLAGIVLLTGMQMYPVQAARKISYQKAVSMYNSRMSYWARRNSKFRITYDLRNCPIWRSYRDNGKRISARSFYYSDIVRYVFRDVSGDGVPEAFFYSKDTHSIVLLTIYRNQVRLLGTFRVADFYPGYVYYNRKNKTFILNTMITGRSSTKCRFQIRNGKLRRLSMLSSYSAPVRRDGRNASTYCINYRKVSARQYRNYYKKYYRYTSRYSWGP